jgi:hypothetical protein
MTVNNTIQDISSFHLSILKYFINIYSCSIIYANFNDSTDNYLLKYYQNQYFYFSEELEKIGSISSPNSYSDKNIFFHLMSFYMLWLLHYRMIYYLCLNDIS